MEVGFAFLVLVAEAELRVSHSPSGRVERSEERAFPFFVRRWQPIHPPLVVVPPPRPSQGEGFGRVVAKSSEGVCGFDSSIQKSLSHDAIDFVFELRGDDVCLGDFARFVDDECGWQGLDAENVSQRTGFEAAFGEQLRPANR